MLKHTLTYFHLALTGMVTAQNLIPNPGFEDTTRCGLPVYSFIETAPPWFTPNQATPDIYDFNPQPLCGYVYDANAVANFGSLSPLEGERVAGAILWEFEGETREYTSVRLLDELITGQWYRLRVHYQLAEFAQFALHRMGALLSTDSIAEPGYVALGAEPTVDLQTGSPLDAVSSWAELQADFQAMGGERYLTIGSFDTYSEAQVTQRPGFNDPQTYYFFDALSLEPVGPQSIQRADAVVVSYGQGDVRLTGDGIDRCPHFWLVDGIGRQWPVTPSARGADHVVFADLLAQRATGAYRLCGITGDRSYSITLVNVR